MSVVHTDSHCVLLTTMDSQADAETLANQLVQSHLAACVSILPQVQSIYVWQGQLQNQSEWMLLIKTTKDKIEALSQFLAANHSYTCPELIELPIHSGLSSYLNWVTEATH